MVEPDPNLDVAREVAFQPDQRADMYHPLARRALPNASRAHSTGPASLMAVDDGAHHELDPHISLLQGKVDRAGIFCACTSASPATHARQYRQQAREPSAARCAAAVVA